MKKSMLLIATAIAIGFYSCAPKYTCPAYGMENIKHKIPTQPTQEAM